MIPYSARSRISESTIYRWIRCYQNSGGAIESLYPEKREDRGKTRKFDTETIAVILNERRKSPHLPVPLFLARLKNKCLVPQTTGLSTIYRLLHQHELMQHTTAPEDRRKMDAFEKALAKRGLPRKLYVDNGGRPFAVTNSPLHARQRDNRLRRHHAHWGRSLTAIVILPLFCMMLP